MELGSILTLLEAVIRDLHENYVYHCRIYNRELLMMGRVDARNM